MRRAGARLFCLDDDVVVVHGRSLVERAFGSCPIGYAAQPQALPAHRCTFPGCGRKRKANGLCGSHETQRQRGQELRPLGPPWRFPSTTDGRWVDPKGYVYIKCPAENHPNAKSKKGWIAEHNWVMTQMLGRPLRPGETVHHRNLIKAEHPGQPGAVDKPSAEGRPCGRSFGVVLVVHPPIRRAP